MRRPTFLFMLTSMMWMMISLAGAAALAETADSIETDATAKTAKAPALDPLDGRWRMDSTKSRGGLQWSVYEETEKTPGRPAFRIETSFAVSPPVAAATLMEEMAEPGKSTVGETRRLLERSEHDALVHTYIDLPFMFSDREVAVRIRHSDDVANGVHRIDWSDENDSLPPAGAGVLRLSTRGHWEFRPDGPGRTRATYETRAEVGGSLPVALGDRLMKGQAVDAVERLQQLLVQHGRIHVAGGPIDLPQDRPE